MKNPMKVISSKQELFEIINYFRTECSSLENEGLAQTLINRYIFGNFLIPKVPKQLIYNESIEIYCREIRRGSIYSKRLLAKELFSKHKYLQNDKDLANLLTSIAAFENESDACHYFEDFYSDKGRIDLAEFWRIKAGIGCYQQLGQCLDVSLNKESKLIMLKYDD